MKNSLWRLTEPLVYIPAGLALGAAAFFLAVAGATGSFWAAFDLMTFRVYGMLLLATVAVSAARARKRCALDGMFPLVARCAALAVLLSAVMVYLFRFEGNIILAEGEAYIPVLNAFTDVKKGPLAPVPDSGFALVSLSPGRRPENFTVTEGLRNVDSSRGTLDVSGIRIRLVKGALVPLVVLASERGAVVDREYVRLAIDSPASQDWFMFDNHPFEFSVRQAGDSAGTGLHVAVRRGKLLIAEGTVDTVSPLKAGGLTISMPEIRRGVVLQMSRQPGHGFFVTACWVFLTLYGWRFWRAARGVQAAGRGR